MTTPADKCDVANSTGTKAISPPVVPRECLADPSRCRRGAKQPLYFAQKTGNNMPDDWTKPPLYNAMYGFANGAQNDIFGENEITWEAGGQLPEGTGSGTGSSTGSNAGSAASPRAVVDGRSVVALGSGTALAAWLLVGA